MSLNNRPHAGEKICACQKITHDAGLIVVTGGPGAGKTAVLEMAKKNFCEHIVMLPEAASIIFGGGFWRLATVPAREAAQRAIFHVQREMEELVLAEKRWALALCDRGTMDGLAYWPAAEEDFWQQVGSSRALELSRYKAVIHLRTPDADMGYNYQNSLRTETPQEAMAIDHRIAQVWSQHPRYVQIPSATNFLEKARLALQVIAEELPSCCHLQN